MTWKILMGVSGSRNFLREFRVTLKTFVSAREEGKMAAYGVIDRAKKREWNASKTRCCDRGVTKGQ